MNYEDYLEMLRKMAEKEKRPKKTSNRIDDIN